MGSRAVFLVAIITIVSTLNFSAVTSGVDLHEDLMAPPVPIEGVVVYGSDLNVTGTLRFLNATIYLTGNLTVKSTGFLEFVNTTLFMNLSRNGQFRIGVEGKFTANDLDRNGMTASDASRIMSNNSALKYTMAAASSSKLYFNNSLVMNCGYDGLNPGMNLQTNVAAFEGMTFQNCYHGMTIRSGGVKVNNSRFLGCQYGLYVSFCNPRLTNLTVSGSLTRGIYLYYSAPTLSGCVLDNNRVGLYMQNSNPNAVGCAVTNSGESGVVTWYSSPLLEDCTLSNAVDMDVRMSSFPRLLNTSLNKSSVKVALGLYVSVGQRMSAEVVNETGEPLGNMSVSVLDSEGNPASTGMTDGTGTAAGLAYRECFITREGIESMGTHRILAFALSDQNATFGENFTALAPGAVAAVRASRNPENFEIWEGGGTVTEPRHRENATVMLLGDLSVNYGGSLELDNCTLMMFSHLTRSVRVASGELRLNSTSFMSVGTPNRLTPSVTGFSVDAASSLRVENSSFRWLSEFAVGTSDATLRNVSVRYVSSAGMKFESCSPSVDGLSIEWAPIGLHLSNCNGFFSNLSVSRSREYAMYCSQSGARFDSVSFSNSSRGLYSYWGALELNRFSTAGCDYGVMSSYTNFRIADSTFAGCAGAGLYLNGGTVKLTGSEITGSATGINALYAALWVEETDISGNGIGLMSDNSAPVLLNSTLSNTVDIDAKRGSSASLVNCTLDPGSISVAVSGWVDLGNWTDVMVIDGAAQPVPLCNVSVRDSSDRVSGSGMTDLSGMARNLAYREKRIRWNVTEEFAAHAVVGIGGANGSQAGTNSTGLGPGGTAVVTIGDQAGSWIIWPSFKNLEENSSFSDANVVAHSGVAVKGGASLELDNSTLWFFNRGNSNTAMDIYAGNFDMRASRLMPLSAKAPLQPTKLWLTYRLGSAGFIEGSLISGISQITTYVDDLSVRNSTVSEIAGTGLHIQDCSPTITGSVFRQCYDGIWSNTGSPAIGNCSVYECVSNGVYLSGGSPMLWNVRVGRNQNGFNMADGSAAVLENCTAVENGCGYYMFRASPAMEGCLALNNSNSGIQMQDSRAVLEGILSEGNNQGVYSYRSWPLILNSTVRGNEIGIHSQESGPYIENCSIDSNGVGLNIIGDASNLLLDRFSSGKAAEESNFIGSGTTDHISLTLPSRAVVRQARMNVTGSEIGNDAVTFDKYSQFSPAIWGDMLVWQDSRNGNWDIYAYDLGADSDGDGVPNYLETPPLADDEALVRITDNEEMQGEPDIYRDTVVWTDFRNGNADIYAYSFSNGTEWAVCTHPAHQAKPSIDGDRIAWQDYRNGDYDIYMLNISTGEQARLSDTNDHDMGVKLHGDYAVWYSYHGSPPSYDYSDIYLFDLKAWKAVNINRDDPVQYSPDIWGDTIVWHDNTNGNWEIYSCNVKTLIPRRLTFDPDGEQNFLPRIHGDRVVYYFHNRITDVWSVRMFNLTTKTQTVLEAETDGDSAPVIWGDRIAWVNKSGNLNDIHVLDLGLGGWPEDVCVDINSDGSAELTSPGKLEGSQTLNGTELADALNLRLKRIDRGISEIPITVSANGTGQVTLGDLSVLYDIPTYILSTAITGSSQSGVYCYNSAPEFINSSFGDNTADFTLNSESRPRALNSTFSDEKLEFMDSKSNLSAQNYLHVRAENLTGQPLDARVTCLDNGQQAFDGWTGGDGEIMWIALTYASYNITGRWDNITAAEATMGTTVFADSPRTVDMSASHWEIFSTDSVGPKFCCPFPQPGWTYAGLRPEISVIITDNLGIEYSSIRLYVQGFMVFYSSASVPGGYNISYLHPADFAEGQVVSCRIYCRDIHGNVLDFSWNFTVDTGSEYFSIELQPGWNLISVPLESYDMSVGNVLWSISGSYDSVKTYSRTADRPWLSYRPSSELNSLASIERARGYWVHATESCVLRISGLPAESTAITLYAGWNLVGYPTFDGTVTLGEALWGTGADRVEVFDPASPYIKEAGPTYIMKPGEGYWVHVPADTIWTIDW